MRSVSSSCCLLLFLRSQLAGVPAGSLLAAYAELEEGRAEAFHLLLHDGPHVEAGDDRTEPACSCDRLQSCDTGTEDEHLRRSDRARQRSSASERSAAGVRQRAARPCSRRRSPVTRAHPSTVRAWCAESTPSRTPELRAALNASIPAGSVSGSRNPISTCPLRNRCASSSLGFRTLTIASASHA